MQYDKCNCHSNIYGDIQTLFEKICNSNDFDRFISYLKEDKNLATCRFIKSIPLQEKRKKLLSKQKNFDATIQRELLLFDDLDIPLIGFKGVFLKEGYYGSIERVYDDIDILVSSYNAARLYKQLLKLGYRIKIKTLYDNPVLKMKYDSQHYMDNTQTLMMFNHQKKISIDIHSNLNITNAHFVKSSTSFCTDTLFKNSIPFIHYKNIYQMELHDNLCVLFRHLLKHHVFYGKTQMGLETPLQHILDVALLINSKDFDEKQLYYKSKLYNVLPEALFCLNLYNKIFLNCKKIDICYYIKEIDNTTDRFVWKPILINSLNMQAEDLMIGNFRQYFPKLQNVIEKSQTFPYFLDWMFQRLYVSINIEKFL